MPSVTGKKIAHSLPEVTRRDLHAVLDCGAAKSLCGAKPVAQMGDKRDTEATDESYHFRGIGNQIVSSFMKLCVPGSIDGGEFLAKRHFR